MVAPQTQEAYRRLRSLILSLRLKPGEALVERKLEEMLDVSRTPIRAAIQQLFREGLVHRTGRVYSVAPIDLEELEEAFEFRKLLEVTGVQLAAQRRPKAKEIKTLLTTLDNKLDPEVELEKATGFHLSLARLSGNRFIASSLAHVLSRIYRARYLEIVRPEGMAEASSDHTHLVELVQNGQAAEAAAFMDKHLERSRERLLGSLRGNTWGAILLGEKGPRR